MKKIVIHSPGNYDQLKIEKAIPQMPQSNEVLVKCKASGINYADICVRWGVYESAKKLVGWPITPGFEFAGEILEVGDKVTDYQVGDQVFGGTFFNGYSGYVTTTDHYISKIPEHYTIEEMGGFSTVFLTAYYGLFENFVTRPGMKILIHSAAGGVGGALLQLAKIQNFETVGIVGHASKVEKAYEFGATQVIDKSQSDWIKAAQKICPEGFDAIFDANGASTLTGSYDLLRPSGKLMIYGFHSMLPKEGGVIDYKKIVESYSQTPRFNPMDLVNHNKSIMAFNLSFLFHNYQLFNKAKKDLEKWLQEKKIRPHHVKSFPIEKVGEAHKLLESGETTGKLVLLH